MKIELQDKNQKVLFSEINIGEVFMYFGEYYIKSKTAYQVMVGVDLAIGTQLAFEDTAEVKTVDCVLTVK